MIFRVLVDFKDHIVEINLVGCITPLFDGVISILFHFNQDFDTFIWYTNVRVTLFKNGSNLALFGIELCNLSFEILDLDIMLLLQGLGELLNKSFFLLFALKSHLICDFLLSSNHVILLLLGLLDKLVLAFDFLINEGLLSITLLINSIGASFHLLLVSCNLLLKLGGTLLLDSLDIFLDLSFVSLSSLVNGRLHSLHVHL